MCVFLLGGMNSAAFAHNDVVLKNSAGLPLIGNESYSPKQSCGGCHFNCATGAYSTDKTTWCDGSEGKLQKDLYDSGQLSGL